MSVKDSVVPLLRELNKVLRCQNSLNKKKEKEERTAEERLISCGVTFSSLLTALSCINRECAFLIKVWWLE